MIVGSGLIAHAFYDAFAQHDDVCIYAAGVSNSNCTDGREFSREKKRLEEALERAVDYGVFVYFGTCSVGDPSVRDMRYVQHKLAMEEMVRMHPRNLILRLPQVAGRTSNPHTLLNYLYARITRSEAFDLWADAKRNIIDVADVVTLASAVIADNSARDIVLNLANVNNYPVIDIVKTMETAVGKVAIYNLVDRRSEYFIDIEDTLQLLKNTGISFSDDYLYKVITKYYGNAEENNFPSAI